jgi:hypothetical protein
MRDDELVIQTKITIQKVDPPIWRRLLLPAEMNLAQLHEVIQASFGWTDSHLHQFIIGGLVFGAPEFDEDGVDERTIFEAAEVHLHDFDFDNVPNPQFLYEYDFGDSWLHSIDVEVRIPRQQSSKYPTCIAGARHCPPEDVGGAHGYAEFLKAWRDPTREEHAQMRRWAGRAFEPEEFNVEKANKAIASALRKAKGGYRFRLER